MRLTKTHLPSILDCVKAANNGYALLMPRGGAESIKSVEYFESYCKGIAKIDVYQHDTLWTPPYPRGFVLTYPASYQIWMLKGLNPCWSRFVLCKELFHVLIDASDKEKLFSNKNIENHIEQYLETNDIEVTPNNVQAELLAEIAAMEFMFPYSHRVQQLGKTSTEIAESYKIPKALVEKYTTVKNMAIFAEFFKS